MTGGLDKDGYEYLRGAARAVLPALADCLRDAPVGQAGVRLRGGAALAGLIARDGAIGRLAARRLGEGARAVRVILFDKTAETNWALGWHQDRTICVAERRHAPGFGPWTVKQGIVHVAPPAELLAAMLTMRVHLDDVDADNAPLLVAGGSHRHGRIAEAGIDAVIAASTIHACLARAGDVWLYRTLILHASARAARPGRRRVLQIDYAAGDLPYGLRWAGA